jgi:hypothetical protein
MMICSGLAARGSSRKRILPSMPWSAPLLHGARADEAQRPPLELIFVLLGQRGGFVGGDGFADGDDLDLVAEGVAQPVLDERGGQLGDVYANPLAAQLLGRVNRRAAAAEWVEDDVVGVAAGGQNSLE